MQPRTWNSVAARRAITVSHRPEPKRSLPAPRSSTRLVILHSLSGSDTRHTSGVWLIAARPVRPEPAEQFYHARGDQRLAVATGSHGLTAAARTAGFGTSKYAPRL